MRGARIDGDRRPQRPRQAFEARFGNMMVVRAVEGRHMQRDRGIDRKGLEPLLNQFGVEGPDLVADEIDLENQERPAGNIDRYPRAERTTGRPQRSATREVYR